MVGNKKNGVITFSFDSKELFNDVSLLSAYMAKNMVAENALDDFIITEDEESVYDVCLRKALPNIYEIMMKLSSGVDNAFGVVELNEEEWVGLRRPVGKYVEFSIVDNEAYNSNVLGLVENTLRDCIEYGVLKEFYSISLNLDMQTLAKAKYAENILLLNQRLFQLKKKNVPMMY